MKKFIPTLMRNLCLFILLFTTILNGNAKESICNYDTNCPLNVVLNQVTATCFGVCDGEIIVNVTGGSPPYTYSQTTSLCAGPHTVTVTDAVGCITTASAYVYEPAQFVINIATTPVSSAGANDGVATAYINGGGVAPFSYQWSNGAISSQINGLPEGTYCVTVTDFRGCTASACNVVQNCPLTMSINTWPIYCFGFCDGQISITPNGGSPPYTILPAQTSGLCAGSYNISVTDAAGCTVTGSTILIEPYEVSASVTTTPISATGANDGTALVITTGGSPAYTYLWSNGEYTSLITGLAPGTYCITVFDAGGCSDVSCSTIQGCSLTATVTPFNNPSCNGQSDGGATVSAMGGPPPYTYLWDTGSTSSSATNLNAGIHTVTVTDGNGCSATAFVLITEPSLLSAVTTATPISVPGANDGAATVSSSGGTTPYTYLWNIGATTPFIDNLGPGTYCCTVTDANWCKAVSCTTVYVLCALNVSTTFTPISAPGANDGAATVNVTNGNAPYTFLWNNGASTQSIVNLTPGNYCCTVTDSNGCQEISCVTVQYCSLGAILTSTSASCFGSCDGSISVVTSGGTPPYTYSPSQLNNLCAGTYSVIVTDSGGCMTSVSTTISEPTQLNLGITTTPISAPNVNDATATANVTGGTLPVIQYIWSNGANTQTIGNLGPGTYCVTIVDAMGCEESDCTIIQGCSINAILTSSPTSCFGECDGAIGISVTGGTPPFTYSPTQTTNLCAGTYIISITDAAGCITTASTTISEPPQISVTLTTTPVSTPGNADGTGTATITNGGVPPYDYIWYNGEYQSTYNTTAIATALPAGYGCVTIVDATGCSTEACGTVGDATSNNNETTTLEEISIYPNPATNVVHLEADFKELVDLEIRVLSSTGQVIQYFSDKSSQKYYRAIDVSRLASGIYFLEQRVNHELRVEKIIKF